MEKCVFKGLTLTAKEGVLITDKYDRLYYSGVSNEEGFLLISKNPAYFTDARYFFALKEKLEGGNITPVLFNGYDSIKTYLKNNGIKRIYVDYTKTTLSEAKTLRSFKIKLLDASSFLSIGRTPKSGCEIEKISMACKIIQGAVEKAVKKLKVGVTEIEIAEEIVKSIKKAGGEGESFSTIVAFGKNSAVPHHQTGQTKLEKDSAVLIDTGAIYKGYCSDITRTYFFGIPNQKFISAYNAVLEANESVIKNVSVGSAYKSAHEHAKEVLKKYKLDGFFTHGLGHGVGLEIHEAPTLSLRGVGNLKENDVFTVEPGVYFDGEFGIRIEDTVVVKQGKIERLFTDDKELSTIN